jgi:hypothetical protein
MQQMMPMVTTSQTATPKKRGSVQCNPPADAHAWREGRRVGG